MSKMIKFPSIEQFRNVIRHVKSIAQFVGTDENGDPVYDQSIPLPTLQFCGTVKLHGTNAGIVYDMDDKSIQYQSRERILSLTRDNAGFMLYMMKREAVLKNIFDSIWVPSGTRKIAIFGEWCGQGIQKGVAISQLPKMFVIFAVKAVLDERSVWLDISDEDFNATSDNIFSIFDFPTYAIDIDFKYPELAQNKMIEITNAVEEECPVGKHFGVSAVGEGVVWTCMNPGFGSAAWFKVKGEKHSASKVKTLSAIDVEAVENIRAFVEMVVTESRLEQGLDNLVREQLKPFEMQSMGDFLRWVYNDVMKEEIDTIVANGIDPKKLGSAIANVARPWYMNKLTESVGL